MKIVKTENKKFCPLIKDMCKEGDCAWLVPVIWDLDTPPVNPEDFKPQCAVFSMAHYDTDSIVDELGRLSSVEQRLGEVVDMLDELGVTLDKMYRSKR